MRWGGGEEEIEIEIVKSIRHYGSNNIVSIVVARELIPSKERSAAVAQCEPSYLLAHSMRLRGWLVISTNYLCSYALNLVPSVQ